MTWPKRARCWSSQEVADDAAKAITDFRARRLGEPLARYLAAFDATAPAVQSMLSDLAKHLDGHDASHWADLWNTEPSREAFRYLGAPPISKDDLKTLADSSLVAAAAQDGERRERLLAVIRAIVDPRRFPWVREQREPSTHELKSAALATSTLIASQRIATQRRNDERAIVEGAVQGLLVGMGWREDEDRPSAGVENLLKDSPPHRCFRTQVNLGSDNADVLARLDDGRLLAVECKGSNSEINSRKRLNKEAAQNARAWLQRFGDQVVPAVALQGVFNARYVVEAQETPLVVFWGHRLADLREFIEASR